MGAPSHSFTMASGIQVADECTTAYQELKLGHKHRYVIYHVTDDKKSIVVEKTAEPGATYDDFVAALPKDDCRYAVYDFEWQADGRTQNKILFYVWSPDTSKIKSKMIYAASKDALKKCLVGIAREVQATDQSELDHSAILELVGRV